MPPTIRRFFPALGLALLPATQAQAQAQGLQVSAGLLSDKVVYGISQSGGRSSAVLDMVQRTDTGWVFSSGLATLGGAPGRPDAEITLGIGRGGALGANGAWQWGYTRNDTVGAAHRRRPGYHQFGLGSAWNERLNLALTANVGLAGPARGGGRVRGTATVAEAGWHQPLASRWALNAGVGHVAYDRVAIANYHFGSLGVGWGVGPVQVFVSRIFSNSRSRNAVGPQALASVLWNL